MRKLKKGFTIVELVIVIGVIAILSAILIPTFVNLSEKAEKSAAKSDVANVYTQYVVDRENDDNAETVAKAIEKVEIVRKNVSYWYVNGEWTTTNPSRARVDDTADFTYEGITLYELA